MKVIIEKELCNIVNGQLVGPLYHLYRLDEKTGVKELVETIDGDIKEAARKAERCIDFDTLEVTYKENPDAFSSVKPTNTTSAKNSISSIKIKDLSIEVGEW